MIPPAAETPTSSTPPATDLGITLAGMGGAPVAVTADAPEVHDHHDEPVTVQMQAVVLAAVVLPVAGLVAAMAFLWGRGFDWVHLSLMGVMYLLTVLGITVGYHRLFTHRAFQTYRPVKAVLGVLGSMAVEGPLLKWVATHRQHHHHSDAEEDPHSPHLHGGGLWGFCRGLFHAHMGWLFNTDSAGLSKYVADLSLDPVLRRVSALFPLWVTLGLLIPAVLGGLFTMSWTGVLLGFLWGGLTRVFLVHHVTWSINSVCHLWGRRDYKSKDESRNNFIFGVLAMGEGWHNNHHAFPTSARHGLRWWQVDVSYWVIRVMSAVGLAWSVRVPSLAAMEAKRA